MLPLGVVMRARMQDVDRARGLAILLVVFGHLVAREPPAGVLWYDPLRIAVYAFHMPFFLYLSGYVAARSPAPQPAAPWLALVRRRAVRLLVPFALFGCAVLAGKLLAARYMAVDNVPPGAGAGVLDLVWFTARSPAESVWFLFALFVFGIAAPPLLRALGGRTAWLFAAALALYALPAPPVAYLDRICTYFVFYVAGVWAADRDRAWLAWVDRWWAPLGAAFVAALAVVALALVPRYGFVGFPYKLWLLGAGLLSMPALHGAMRRVRAPALLWLGGYSFVIYLLNTVFIGLTKAALLRWMIWEAADFVAFATILMLAGVLGPIAVKSLLLRRSQALDRATS